MINQKQKTILFTAFEPSGDALGAMAARGLLMQDPEIKLYGLGGKLMEESGVTLLAETTNDAAMGIGAVSEIMRVKRLINLVRDWIRSNQPNIVIPVDSPAANFPVCKVARKSGRTILHLAAPQMWAWAPWRIHKMRKLTDHVLCLLPFEPEWFQTRGVKATFIGHPAMCNHSFKALESFTDHPRIILLPGSRASEIANNLPMQCQVFSQLQHDFPNAVAIIACREEDLERVSPLAGDIPIISNNLPAILNWGDLALTVSGTVSLHVMRHATPMIGMYRVGMMSRIAAKLLLNAQYRLLPNLIAGREIAPEFIPCGYMAKKIADVAHKLLADSTAMEKQRHALNEVTSLYESHDPSAEAAKIILSYC